MKPLLIRPFFANIPQELQDINNWILWKLVVRDGKETKIPWSAYDQPAKTNDPSTWVAFDSAVGFYDPSQHAGIGFVFSQGCGYAGVDLDSCRNPKTLELAEWAMEWINKLDSYTEVSPSGTGVKIWLKTSLDITGINSKIDAKPMPGCTKKPGIEAYTKGRYFAMTGFLVRGFNYE